MTNNLITLLILAGLLFGIYLILLSLKWILQNILARFK